MSASNVPNSSSRGQPSGERYLDIRLLPDEDTDLRREILAVMGEEWLYAKNVLLAGRSPAELIGTPDEFQVRLVFRSVKGADLS